MLGRKIVFIDRDGTLIREPEDKQVDTLEKFELMPNVIPALQQLIKAGYELVMVSNQDGLGTSSFPQQDFDTVQALMIRVFSSQNIEFVDVLICPHLSKDQCECRKPKTGLVRQYLKYGVLNTEKCAVIGDRNTDVELANNMGIQSLLYQGEDWLEISRRLLEAPRISEVTRITTETKIRVMINLDQSGSRSVKTGIGFFDHMLDQIIKHAGISASIMVEGDLEIDEHHTIEDTALALGEAMRQALSDKRGIQRYGFLLPMDESLAQVALDLSGRAFCQFSGTFSRESVGGLATEMIPHFFRSFAQGLGASLNIVITGENCHHMIESAFKGLGRTLKQAIAKNSSDIPSTKGVLC